MEEKVIFYKENCNDMMDWKLTDKIFYICSTLFDKYRPGEYVPPKSVSVGNIYESSKSKSCQVRYTKNEIIIKVTYSKEDYSFKCEIYELTHIKNTCYCYDIENIKKGKERCFCRK